MNISRHFLASYRFYLTRNGTTGWRGSAYKNNSMSTRKARILDSVAPASSFEPISLQSPHLDRLDIHVQFTSSALAVTVIEIVASIFRSRRY